MNKIDSKSPHVGLASVSVDRTLTEMQQLEAMAAKLLVSQRAVEMRRASIMRKLQVRSLPELLRLTVTHRILSELRAAEQGPPREKRSP